MKLKKYKKPKLPRLISHSINYGFGEVLGQFIGFLLLPLYTRYLTPSDYGIVEITAALTAFAVPLMKLGLPGSVTRQYFDYTNDTIKLNNYITTVYKLLNLSAFIIGIFLLIFFFFTHELIFKGLDFWPFIVMAIISSGLSSNNQLQQKIIQNKEQSKYSVILQTAFTITSIMTAILLVTHFRMGALGIILAGFIANIVFFIQAYYFLKKYTIGMFQKSMAIDALRYGSGLLPHHLSSAAAPLISKSLLINMGSMAALGSFSIGLRFSLPLELLYTMMNTAFTPIYIRLRKTGDNVVLQQNVRIVFVIGIIAYSLMQLVGPWLMKLVLPPSYYSAVHIFPILCIAFIGRTVYSICGLEIFFSKKTRFISIITVSGLLVNLILCVALVNKYQEVAISWAYSISSIICAIIGYYFKVKISNHQKYNLEILLFIVISTVVTVIAYKIYSV